MRTVAPICWQTPVYHLYMYPPKQRIEPRKPWIQAHHLSLNSFFYKANNV